MSDFNFKFNGVKRLIGDSKLEKVKTSHVAIIGLGGVGSWSAEALIRSGVEKLTFIDLDEICSSNINRQIHALDINIGKSKIEMMKERALLINPNSQINLIHSFYSPKTYEEILNKNYDYIIDAIDGLENKAHLLNECVKRKIKVCTIGGAGGKTDPSLIRRDDLNFSRKDPLCFNLRKRLKQRYGFTRDKTTPFGIDCIFSLEDVHYYWPNGEVSIEKIKRGRSEKLDCFEGLGSASFLTGAMGFAAAHQALIRLGQ